MLNGYEYEDEDFGIHTPHLMSWQVSHLLFPFNFRKPERQKGHPGSRVSFSCGF